MAAAAPRGRGCRAAAGGRVIAGPGEVQLAAQPGQVLLGAPAGIAVIRRGDLAISGRDPVAAIAGFPPADHLPPVLADRTGEALDQHGAQHLHRRDLAQPRRRRLLIARRDQRIPVPGVSHGEPVPLRLARGHPPPGTDPGAVTALPVAQAEPGREPVRARRRQRRQRRPHALPGQLGPMQRPHRRDHLRGISPLLAARPDQAVRGQLRQQRVQHRLLQLMPGDPAAELAQHAVIEPRITQAQPQQVLPVQPGPHRLRRLPAAQILHHLQHRHHRQPRRRPPRTPPHPERRREQLISHPLPQPVPHRHRQRHPPPRVLRPDRRRDHRIRLRPRHRTHRHHTPDSATAEGERRPHRHTGRPTAKITS